MDKNRRELERGVVSSPDDVGARQALTMAMLRSRSGVAAWWPGTDKPHEAAVKTAIGFETMREDGSVRNETVGWLLAVTTATDVLEIAALRAGVRLIDLATMRTVGLFGQSGAVTPDEPKEDDGVRGRPRVLPLTESVEGQEWAHGHMPMPIVAPILVNHHGIGVKVGISESLWDSEMFIRSGTVTTYRFFANTRTFHEASAGTKVFGQDVNLVGNGGALPPSQHMVVNGISMLASAAANCGAVTRKVMDVLRSTGQVRLIFGGRVMEHELPAHAVFPAESDVAFGEADEDVVRLNGSAPAIYPFAVPFVLSPLMHFEVELRFYDSIPLRDAVNAAGMFALKITCLLHGTRFIPQAG